MSTTEFEAKVTRLLTSNAVQVQWATDQVINSAVRGDSGVHDVRWSRLHGWSCSCPCLGECTHVVATRGVTMRSVAGARQ